MAVVGPTKMVRNILFKRTEFESLVSEMKGNLVLGEQSTLKTQELQQALKVVQDSINYLRQEVQAEKDKQVKKILFFDRRFQNHL